MSAYVAVGVGIVAIALYSSTDYIATYFTSPVVQALRHLGSSSSFTQSSYYNVVSALKDSTTTTTTLKSTSSDPTSQSSLVETILRTEQIDPADPTFLRMLPRLQKVVRGIVLESTACANFEIIRQLSFDDSNVLHNDLLESMWNLLCSNEPPRDSHVSGGRKSKSWSRVGFQGVDPVTDLRGMGLLGLFQLVHFARTPQSQHVLAWSRAPQDGPEVKFFPFACAGIQITSLVLTLAREHLLGFVVVQGEDEKVNWSSVNVREESIAMVLGVKVAEQRLKELLREVRRNGEQGHHQDTNDDDMVWRSIALLNDVYGEIFMLLGEAWKRENPPDVMSYPNIFKSVEANVRAALTAEAGVNSFKIRWRC